MSTASQPQHTNHLIDATSPYLLQHAHNPVDWYPWGDEALAKAKRQDKPIFLSIGYSACHWCHVMEHESFENEEIAAILNEHFVAIKVDREERPDLDETYMAATVLYNQGQGGWPMSVFLTPDRRPFFAGTYFPPESRYGRPGFKELLTEIARLWNDERPRLLGGADALTDAVRRYQTIEAGRDVPGIEALSRATVHYLQAFDRDKGGMLSGGSNKFPPSMAMQIMLRQYHHSLENKKPNRELIELVTLTLDQMARGGIYDQLGGGICRYSTDPQWLVPHFEKMLYDQALVSSVYLDAQLVTKKPLYAHMARDIFDYVIRDLQSPDGGFYSARDADSEGQEGKYYVWTYDEIEAALGKADAAVFCDYYNVTPAGNWHEMHGHAPSGPRNILHITESKEDVARRRGISIEALQESLDRGRQKLLQVRQQRTPPGLDDKVLTAWNGLMIASLAKGSRILNDTKYRDAAVRAADFVLARLTHDGRLLRTYRNGTAHTYGYLDDYAFFIEGTLNLYEATFDPKWLDEAVRLTDQTIEHFYDESEGGFFFTADDAEVALVRSKGAGDSATPSGNSVHAMNLLRLAAILGRDDYRAKAESIFKVFGPRMAQMPLGFDRLLAALDFYHHGPKEIALILPAGGPPTPPLAEAVWQAYLPNHVVVLRQAGNRAQDALAARIPLLRGRMPVDGRATAYVCENYACQRPVTETKALLQQLAVAE